VILEENFLKIGPACLVKLFAKYLMKYVNGKNSLTGTAVTKSSHPLENRPFDPAVIKQ